MLFLGMRIRTSRLALNPGLAEDEEDSETEFQQDDPLGMVILEPVLRQKIWEICAHFSIKPYVVGVH